MVKKGVVLQLGPGKLWGGEGVMLLTPVRHTGRCHALVPDLTTVVTEWGRQDGVGNGHGVLQITEKCKMSPPEL